MLLVKAQSSNHALDLDELMRYPLMPVPRSLGTPDGFLCKTNKATLMNAILQDVAPSSSPNNATLFIQDGNALFHELTNRAPTFGGICLQLLGIMVSKKDFVFSTDSYFPNSLKDKRECEGAAVGSLTLMDRQLVVQSILKNSYQMMKQGAALEPVTARMG
ncbi:hypothetical protein DPMN_094301 [Dreissena polymorpha]|uniref:Uncharacterized protein n=1 Tax=Dreissena polymorpha TaxID=45954 RepID=A0A9D4L5I2_DREPO|nr:hypothetical protein DPMN_094301 [Dreissena polymorpha]